jgi:hypothetical protein
MWMGCAGEGLSGREEDQDDEHRHIGAEHVEERHVPEAAGAL